jgi:hypothetical protein
VCTGDPPDSSGSQENNGLTNDGGAEMKNEHILRGY